MKFFELGLSLFLFFLRFNLNRGESEIRLDEQTHANFPPRGWNSYDSFSWIISEEEFLQNAEVVSQKLLVHDYQYVVVDFLWYRRKVPGAYTDSLGFDVIDEWGRVIPDPERWPSSKGGNGFKEVAKRVHEMGLKFGIHVMRGISTQAVNANTPIFDLQKGSAYVESGKVWRARDIGLKDRACAWMPRGFMSVDTNLGAGRAFLRSLYQQYAEWGVDFVKHDCVFGSDLDLNEIRYVSEVLKDLDPPMLYSLSPGTSVTPSIAKEVSTLVNMYRITGDDWDTWNDVEFHFDISRDIAASHLIGAKGLLGKSWPDLDMLPLGRLTDPGSNKGPHRNCRLTLHEQQTQMTLWSMAKSPLMFGGDLRQIDRNTFDLITHPVLLEINYFSEKNQEFPYVSTKNYRSDETEKAMILKSLKSENSGQLALTSCKDSKARGWMNDSREEHLDKICWKHSLKIQEGSPFCIYKKRPKSELDVDIMDNQRDKGKFYLTETRDSDLCFDGSFNEKLTSGMSRTSFSPCSGDLKKIWALSSNGTLVNEYSGLCAIVTAEKGFNDNKNARSWIASGREGEIYIALFNLSPRRMTISVEMEGIVKILPSSIFGDGSCNCSEIWSGKELGIVEKTLSMKIASHGCALFVLKCNKHYQAVNY